MTSAPRLELKNKKAADHRPMTLHNGGASLCETLTTTTGARHVRLADSLNALVETGDGSTTTGGDFKKWAKKPLPPCRNPALMAQTARSCVQVRPRLLLSCAGNCIPNMGAD